MILTPSDVASLTRALSYWEYGEYACAVLVTIGCLGEYVSEFTDWFTAGIKERKERLARRSTLLLIGALALELVCLVRTNQVSGVVIGALDDRAMVALSDSNTAIAQAGTAATKAQAAEDTSGRAVAQSNKAEGVASRAMILADGARTEADSFEAKITSAEEKAMRLEQQLAWRTITKEQSDKLKNSLGGFLAALPARLKIRVAYLAGDPEGGEYADELAGALRTVGAEVLGPTSETILSNGPGGPPQGILLQVDDANTPGAALLQQALKAAGIEAPGQISKGQGVITLLVGVKPHPTAAAK